MVRLIGKRFFTAYDGAASQGEHLPFWGQSVEGSPTRGKKAGTTHSQPKVAHKNVFHPKWGDPLTDHSRKGTFLRMKRPAIICRKPCADQPIHSGENCDQNVGERGLR